jgi:hypothetical protein
MRQNQHASGRGTRTHEANARSRRPEPKIVSRSARRISRCVPPASRASAAPVRGSVGPQRGDGPADHRVDLTGRAPPVLPVPGTSLTVRSRHVRRRRSPRPQPQPHRRRPPSDPAPAAAASPLQTGRPTGRGCATPTAGPGCRQRLHRFQRRAVGGDQTFRYRHQRDGRPVRPPRRRTGQTRQPPPEPTPSRSTSSTAVVSQLGTSSSRQPDPLLGHIRLGRQNTSRDKLLSRIRRSGQRRCRSRPPDPASE